MTGNRVIFFSSLLVLKFELVIDPSLMKAFSTYFCPPNGIIFMQFRNLTASPISPSFPLFASKLGKWIFLRELRPSRLLSYHDDESRDFSLHGHDPVLIYHFLSVMAVASIGKKGKVMSYFIKCFQKMISHSSVRYLPYFIFSL